MGNYVYIAASIDGFIARSDGALDWLLNIENPEKTDYGYGEFIGKIDAIVMGRKSYEYVKTIEPWPYERPVFVLSGTLNPGPIGAVGAVSVINLDPRELVGELASRGYGNLYIDGGATIRGFLKEDLIDELTITTVPILLGSGIPLFGAIGREVRLKHVATIVYDNGLVKSTYVRR